MHYTEVYYTIDKLEELLNLVKDAYPTIFCDGNLYLRKIRKYINQQREQNLDKLLSEVF